jgi:hypothetical protein
MRAKSRNDRWQEEVAITCHEMVWVLRWFESRRAGWVSRAEASSQRGKPGLVSYAKRQADSWKEFRDISDALFRGANPFLESVFGYDSLGHT